MSKIPVGILGCTGAVGQQFIMMLQDHPWFVISDLGASDRSKGKTYVDAVRWIKNTDIPQNIQGQIVKGCVPSEFSCKIVFSGLDSSVAGEVESDFASAGFAVFSNSRNHRMDPDVPLLIPQVNGDHLGMVKHQQQQHGYKGYIATNPNCSTTGLVIALKPLFDAFGIDQAMVFTMQAVSGAGYPGVSSLDIMDNVVPYIGQEEDKIETEPCKILGGFDGSNFIDAPMDISAHCNRVPVMDGHTITVSLKFKKKATLEEVTNALASFRSEIQDLNLPSAPASLIAVRPECDRPQPRLDRNAGNGMCVSVGRVRECPLFGFKLVLVVHNTIMGAAGNAILNAELAKVKNLLP